MTRSDQVELVLFADDIIGQGTDTCTRARGNVAKVPAWT